MKRSECNTVSLTRHMTNAVNNAARFYFALRFVFFGFWLTLIPIREDCSC